MASRIKFNDEYIQTLWDEKFFGAVMDFEEFASLAPKKRNPTPPTIYKLGKDGFIDIRKMGRTPVITTTSALRYFDSLNELDPDRTSSNFGNGKLDKAAAEQVRISQ